MAAKIIPLNNFLMYGSLGCIVPYLSSYYMHYTTGTPGQLGRVMLFAHIASMIVNLTVCSLADRYKAHWLVYLSAMIVTYGSFLSLFIPIIFEQFYETHKSHYAPVNPVVALAGLSGSFKHGHELNASSFIDDPETPTSELEIDVDIPLKYSWTYLVSACLIIGEIGSTLNQNFCNSFSANNAVRLDKSFGSLRFWGGIGSVLSSILLSFINLIEWAPFLCPALILFTIFALCNLLMVAMWPDKRSFDLSDEYSSVTLNGGSAKDGSKAVPSATKFSFAFSLDSFKQNRKCKKDLRLVDVGCLVSKSPVVPTKLGPCMPFDTRIGDVYRNIRRCSQAPLGDDHLVKQFELNEDKGKHFKFVTKIEPRDPEMQKVDYAFLDSDLENLRSLARQENKAQNLPIRVQFTIIKMIISNDNQILRYLLLYVVNGFTVNLNLLYLFPYLESLDKLRFHSISTYIMIACYMAEALFYYTETKFTRTMNKSVNLSMILLIHGVRYSLYLVFAIQELDIPLELIIIVELVQAFNLGWFVCVFNESAVDFAANTKDCVPELIKRGLIDGSEKTIEQVHGSVKVSMLGICSCCFDGFGMALGSLCGGLIIDHFGYQVLWIASASLSFSIGLANLCI